MSFQFGGYQLTPGMHDDRFTLEAQIYWGRWDQIEYLGVIIDKDAVDALNTPTTQLRAGMALGKQTTGDQLLQWNPYATDGTQVLVGFLLGEIETILTGSTTAERVFAVMVKGNIKADQIVIPNDPGASAARGIVGTEWEFLLREQAHGRFLFDDDIGALQQRKTRTITLATTAVTATNADNKTLFVLDTTAAADCTVTLPAPVPGLTFYACNASTTAGIELIFDGPAGSEFLVLATAADNITYAEDLSYLQEIRAIQTVDGTYQYVTNAIS